MGNPIVHSSASAYTTITFPYTNSVQVLNGVLTPDRFIRFRLYLYGNYADGVMYLPASIASNTYVWSSKMFMFSGALYAYSKEYALRISSTGYMTLMSRDVSSYGNFTVE